MNSNPNTSTATVVTAVLNLALMHACVSFFKCLCKITSTNFVLVYVSALWQEAVFFVLNGVNRAKPGPLSPNQGRTPRYQPSIRLRVIAQHGLQPTNQQTHETPASRLAFQDGLHPEGHSDGPPGTRNEHPSIHHRGHDSLNIRHPEPRRLPQEARGAPEPARLSDILPVSRGEVRASLSARLLPRCARRSDALRIYQMLYVQAARLSAGACSSSLRPL